MNEISEVKLEVGAVNIKGASSSVEELGDPDKRCRYCDERISKRARICFHCGRPQEWKLHYLDLASVLGVMVSFALLCVSALQYANARKDRVDAADALRSAKLALAQAAQARSILTEQANEINEYSEDLFSSICEIANGAFVSRTRSCQLKDGRAIPYDKVFRKGAP